VKPLLLEKLIEQRSYDAGVACVQRHCVVLDGARQGVKLHVQALEVETPGGAEGGSSVRARDSCSGSEVPRAFTTSRLPTRERRVRRSTSANREAAAWTIVAWSPSPVTAGCSSRTGEGQELRYRYALTGNGGG
jgi:hypothetical protein